MVFKGHHAVREQTFTSVVKLKQKPHEFAKPGKYARITCDLGTPASLRAGWLPEAVKHSMSEVREVVGGVLIGFVNSPDPVVVGECFDAMLTRPCWWFFSDDATVSLPVLDDDGVVRLAWFNVDISSCDSSCSQSVAELLLSCCPQEDHVHMRALIKQLSAPCSLGRGPGRMLFRPVTLFEYSGSVLTTALNNCSMFTAASFCAEQWSTPSRKFSVELLEALLLAAGWRCSVELCECFEDVQFLKQSPVLRESGRYGAMLNLGVVLRSIGQCRFDLPGSGPLEERARLHNSSVIRGMLPGGLNPVVCAYVQKFGVVAEAAEAFYGFPRSGVGPTFDSQSMCRRYRVELHELEHFLDVLRESGFGHVIDTPFSRAVLAKDYGY